MVSDSHLDKCQQNLADYLELSVDQLVDSRLIRLKNALVEQNIPVFIQLLQSVFASIPYTLFLEEEASYHDVIYILEFTMSTATIALQQIRDKGYAQAYQGSSKTIILVGIAFDKEKRNITD